MQLEFEQAMTDFRTMFPDMDSEVIEAILRCNNGAVDATIDQLLAMSTDNQVRIACFRPSLLRFINSLLFSAHTERETTQRNGAPTRTRRGETQHK